MTHEKLSVSLSALTGRQEQNLSYSPAAFASGVVTFGESAGVDEQTQVATLVAVADALQFMESLPRAAMERMRESLPWLERRS